jgi:DNA invertase Pin-like site-specific DNA recombinase
MKAIAYYRVSTDKQGESGYGLEAQKSSVERYCKSAGLEIIGEHTDIESGKKNARPGLATAIQDAARTGSRLVIAKLDRLSRNFMFIMSLKESGVDFVACDMPEANTLTVGIMALMAQQEREMISARTSAALQAKIRRGEKLGTPRNFSEDGRKKGAETNRLKRRMNQANVRAAGVVKELSASGMTVAQIADWLNANGFRTARDCEFRPTTVARLVGFTGPGENGSKPREKQKKKSPKLVA